MSNEQVQERNFNVKVPTRFRYAYVFKPGNYEFSRLKPAVDRFVYATDGYAESTEEIHAQLEEGLKDFDATKDLLIPVGGSVISTQAGAIIAALCHRRNWDGYALSVYTSEGYELWWIPLTPGEIAWRFEVEGVEKTPKDWSFGGRQETKDSV